MGLAIQSVSASPNSAAKNQKNLLSHGVNGAYIKNLVEPDQTAVMQRMLQMPVSEGQRTSLTATGTNFNISGAKASYSAQKNFEHMRNNLQDNASNKGYAAPAGAQSQSKISMKQAEGN